MRCVLLVSALCLASCDGSKSECPCAPSLLGHRWVVWTGESNPPLILCPGSSFRMPLEAARPQGMTKQESRGQEPGCKGQQNRQKPQALHPIRCITPGDGQRSCEVPPLSLLAGGRLHSSDPGCSCAEETPRPSVTSSHTGQGDISSDVPALALSEGLSPHEQGRGECHGARWLPSLS